MQLAAASAPIPDRRVPKSSAVATAAFAFLLMAGAVLSAPALAEDLEDQGLNTDYTPGTRFRDCSGCPEMVVLPPGTFLMGSSKAEAGRRATEGPVHRVTIGQTFALGVYEVTFAEWEACVEDGGCDGYRPKRRFFGRNWGHPQYPVMRVDPSDIEPYLAWLSKRTGERYRLPSEAE
ncbi:MAG: formylglycine-generating enzyme family protein, partial [Gammaproteobacteria bacterium]|nr:formylglycine-generating enzyme family protein [Gammaproteobacteria bacterium]